MYRRVAGINDTTAYYGATAIRMRRVCALRIAAVPSGAVAKLLKDISLRGFDWDRTGYIGLLSGTELASKRVTSAGPFSPERPVFAFAGV